MEQIVNFFKRIAFAFFAILRFFNLLEPSDKGELPGRDYFPILSWSKIARIIGLFLILIMFFSGQPFDVEFVVAILTWVGGETAYRFRQVTNRRNKDDDSEGVKGSAVDNPDQEP